MGQARRERAGPDPAGAQQVPHRHRNAHDPLRARVAGIADVQQPAADQVLYAVGEFGGGLRVVGEQPAEQADAGPPRRQGVLEVGEERAEADVLLDQPGRREDERVGGVERQRVRREKDLGRIPVGRVRAVGAVLVEPGRVRRGVRGGVRGFGEPPQYPVEQVAVQGAVWAVDRCSGGSSLNGPSPGGCSAGSATGWVVSISTASVEVEGDDPAQRGNPARVLVQPARPGGEVDLLQPQDDVHVGPADDQRPGLGEHLW